MAATDDHAVTFTVPEVILFSGDVERAAEFQPPGPTGPSAPSAYLAWPPPRSGSVGSLTAWVQDPDGHPVQLVQRFNLTFITGVGSAPS
jgi:hypothetical protein